MIFDLQKATIWKRVSAWLFDTILLGMLIVGIAFGMSSLLGYDGYSDTVSQAYSQYEQQYGTTFAISEEEYYNLDPDQQQRYLDAYEALTKDQEVMHAYSMMVNLTLVITSISILAGFVILEFVVPLLFRNGQTLGKKIFGIGVMRTDGIRISTVQLFTRTILGKYTIETMIPVLMVMMIFFGFIGVMGTMLIFALAVIQVVLLISTRNNSLIHDCLAGTVVIDIASQMIFDTEEAMIEYKKEIYAEQAARQDY